MHTKSHSKLIEGLRSRLNEFRSANGANVTITFALATIPMIGFVGAAVDYSHANSVQDCDAGRLGCHRADAVQGSNQADGAQIQTKGNDYFKALFTRPEATGLAIKRHLHEDRRLAGDRQGQRGCEDRLHAVDGLLSKLKVAVDSHARWGTTKLQVALALDTTGSMASDNKMPALKTATKELLDDPAERRHHQRRRPGRDRAVRQVRPRRCRHLLQCELDRLGRLGRR